MREEMELAWGLGIWRAGDRGQEKLSRGRLLDVSALASALLFMLYLVPMVPVIFMSDGTKSVAVTAAALVLFLALPLTAVDALIAPKRAR